MSSSHQAKLTLRAPPHQPFVQGWPGIPPGQGRPAAHIKGTVEVRLGGKGLKASWLRIELRKIESTPTGENWGELIGRGPIEVWSADGTSEKDSEGNWDLLQTADFPFKVMIPEGLPPSARLDKQSGIAYELVTSLCVKVKKGLLRKEDTSSVIQSSHPVTLEKHELHSTWPIYSVPDDHEEMVNQVIARVYRKQTCFGPGDKVELRVILTSKNVSPVKIKTVAVSIRETITFKGNKRQSRMLGPATKTANQRMVTLAQKAQTIGSKIYKGDVKTYDLSLVIPKSHQLMTIQTAKHIEVSYTMRIYVDCKNPIILDHLPLTITTVPRATSATIVPKIGFVPGLSAAMHSQESVRYGETIQRPQSASDRSRVRIEEDAVNGSSNPPSSNRRQGPPTRSFSFVSTAPSNTSSDRTYQAALDRRDTVRTTASGPGLAGRGIPGQIFAYGSYGQPTHSPFGDNQGPVRLAFAGPASIYEGRELNPEENRALFHHSASNHLGQVFEGQDPVPAVNYDGVHSGTHTPSRSHVGTPSEISVSPHGAQRRSRIVSEADGYLDARPYQQQQLNGSYGSAVDATQPLPPSSLPASPSPHDAAEMEKERLYRRAREQAERNQRRAAAAAAAAAAGTTSPRPGVDSPTSRRVVSSPPASAVNEKQALYERARKEAERYQAGFQEGATFPQEDLPPAHAEPSELAYAAPATRQRHSMAAQSPSPSPVIATPTPHRGALSGFPTAEEEKKRLYDAAKAERDSYLAAQPSPAASRPQSVVAGASSSSGTTPASASMPGGFPSADEEKRRFEAARAQTDAFLRAQQGGPSGSGSGSGSARPASQYNGSAVPPVATYNNGPPTAQHNGPPATSTAASSAQVPAPPSILVNGSAAAARGLMSAEEEKKMLYEKAKAEVESHGAASAGGSASGGSRVVSTPAYPSAEEEKRALYEKARAEVDAFQSGNSGSNGGAPPYASNAPPYASASSSTPTHAPPRPPASADDEKAQLKRYWEAQDAVARHQQESSAAPFPPRHHSQQESSAAPFPGSFPMDSSMSQQQDDSASIISIPYRSPSVAAGKQRSLPSPTASPPPTLPTLSFSSLSAALPVHTQAQTQTPSHPHPHTYAPRIASPNWHHEEEEDSGISSRLPPPLPPKTPLKH